ncbi:hypothetical protein [Psychroflexus planctonicus]|uniref:Inovirus Gp2 family protein n=1 Tax=Psychroflexus planctonicus TaxID=1526575 RepID=A0ABQ1SGB3_9FLAO|nr:hypothetical protein [Psychroflexus planctonicus]GGE31533.1 hypothetical protein GCM10010832_09880 [Psychroflexus planctonicus]
MLKFKYKIPLREKSNKDTKLTKNISAPKQEMYEKIFKDLNTGKDVRISDVDSIKYKRNKLISHFFTKYKNRNKYQFFEFGIPYNVSISVTPIVQKIRRRCKAQGLNLIAYIWVYDVGDENFGEHYHLAIATNQITKSEYPDALKIDFHKKSIHGAFVRNAKRFEKYLKKKEVFERGYRKRTYGASKSLKIN